MDIDRTALLGGLRRFVVKIGSRVLAGAGAGGSVAPLRRREAGSR
jgi:hypothetical protein